MAFVTSLLALLLSFCITFNRAAPIPHIHDCTVSNLSTSIPGDDNIGTGGPHCARTQLGHCSPQLWQQDSQTWPSLGHAMVSNIFGATKTNLLRGTVYKCRRIDPKSAFHVTQISTPHSMHMAKQQKGTRPENSNLRDFQHTTRRLLHFFQSVPGNLLVAAVFAILILAALLSSLVEMGWSR